MRASRSSHVHRQDHRARRSRNLHLHPQGAQRAGSPGVGTIANNVVACDAARLRRHRPARHDRRAPSPGRGVALEGRARRRVGLGACSASPAPSGTGARQHDRARTSGATTCTTGRRLRRAAVRGDERLGRLHRPAHDRSRRRQPERTFALATQAPARSIRTAPTSASAVLLTRRFHEERVHLQAHHGRRRAAGRSDAAGRGQFRGPQRRRDLDDDAAGAHAALQKARGPGESLDDVRRRMADFVVGGLKMAGRRDLHRTARRDSRRPRRRSARTTMRTTIWPWPRPDR